MVANATEIISDDGDIAAICERWGFPVRSIEDLPIPSFHRYSHPLSIQKRMTRKSQKGLALDPLKSEDAVAG
jgi:hypothetical protein